MSYLETILLAFDEDEHPRDDHGRFGDKDEDKPEKYTSHKEWDKSLTDDEKKSISDWSLSTWDKIRAGEKNPSADTKELVDQFHAAIDKAPDTTAMVYRSIANVTELQRTENGQDWDKIKTITFNATSSATKDSNVAMNDFLKDIAPKQSYNMVLRISGKSLVDISDQVDETMKDQKEHLIRRGTTYEVNATARVQKMTNSSGEPIYVRFIDLKER